jgi:hypothetical protein
LAKALALIAASESLLGFRFGELNLGRATAEIIAVLLHSIGGGFRRVELNETIAIELASGLVSHPVDLGDLTTDVSKESLDVVVLDREGQVAKEDANNAFACGDGGTVGSLGLLYNHFVIFVGIFLCLSLLTFTVSGRLADLHLIFFGGFFVRAFSFLLGGLRCGFGGSSSFLCGRLLLVTRFITALVLLGCGLSSCLSRDGRRLSRSCFLSCGFLVLARRLVAALLLLCWCLGGGCFGGSGCGLGGCGFLGSWLFILRGGFIFAAALSFLSGSLGGGGLGGMS